MNFSYHIRGVSDVIKMTQLCGKRVEIFTTMVDGSELHFRPLILSLVAQSDMNHESDGMKRNFNQSGQWKFFP